MPGHVHVTDTSPAVETWDEDVAHAVRDVAVTPDQ